MKPLLELVDDCKSNDDVRKLLEYLFELDQLSLRNEGEVALKYGIDSKEHESAHNETVRLNKEYVEVIKKVISKFGWLNEGEVGKIANQTLWIIVQHSDLNTQQEFYPLMEKECENGNVSKEHLAKLVDRMLILEGKEQLYGTQFRTNKDFSYELYPIKDIEEVDLRRSEVGLNSLQDELDNMNKIHQSKMSR